MQIEKALNQIDKCTYSPNNIESLRSLGISTEIVCIFIWSC